MNSPNIHRALGLVHDWLCRDETHERSAEIGSGAVLSETHRLLLWRHWSFVGDVLPWIMLNPSTADASTDDRTIRRCIDFSKRWGYGGMVVANLFSLRSPYPDLLAEVEVEDAIGPGNDMVLAAIACRAPVVVCGWGRIGRFQGRGVKVLDDLRANGSTPMCLGVNGDRSPKHPLYVRASTTLAEVPR